MNAKKMEGIASPMPCLFRKHKDDKKTVLKVHGQRCPKNINMIYTSVKYYRREYFNNKKQVLIAKADSTCPLGSRNTYFSIERPIFFSKYLFFLKINYPNPCGRTVCLKHA